jgi:hypothetical protein
MWLHDPYLLLNNAQILNHVFKTWLLRIHDIFVWCEAEGIAHQQGQNYHLYRIYVLGFSQFYSLIILMHAKLWFLQVIPQALCSRHGLAIGANLVWLVKILMVLCFPISYPVGKVFNSLPCNHACSGESLWKTHGWCISYITWLQILDYLLGHSESALFRRAQLKALVSIHGKEVSSVTDVTTCEIGLYALSLSTCILWLLEMCRSCAWQTSGMT